MEEFMTENPMLTIAMVSAFFDGLAGVLPDKYTKYIGVLRRVFSVFKKNKKTVAKCIALPLIIVGVGCSGMQPSQVCKTEEPSVICEKIPQPEHADIILQIGNLRAIKGDIYSGKEAIAFLEKCEAILSEQKTYKDLTQKLVAEINEVDIEIIVLSEYVNKLKVDLPISDFDRNLLKQHIENQKKIIKLYMSK